MQEITRAGKSNRSKELPGHRKGKWEKPKGGRG